MSNMIKSLEVELAGTKLTGRVIISDLHVADCRFAFYLLKNGKRVKAFWYSAKDSFVFDTNGDSGYYRVQAFVKFKNDVIETAKSSPVFANPLDLKVEDISDQALVEQTYRMIGKYWSFPALFYPSDNDVLFVMMPSAINRKKVELPVFNRWTWASNGVFPGNVLCVADPTLGLNEGLEIGWCIGNSGNDATLELSMLVKKVAEVKNIPNDRIIIWGSSAGGFSALALSSYIEGSVAVAINAQTDILSYENRKQVGLVRKYCFDDMSEGDIRAKFSDRVDLSSSWLSKSRVVLVQNRLDTHYYETHFQPFWGALGGDDNMGISCAGKNVAWLYEQEGGHVPESVAMAKKIISLLNL